MSQKRIAVFGASGATGREVVRHALRAGLEVVAIDRSQPDEEDRLEGVTYRQADVLEDDLADAMKGCDAVISTLGVAFSPSNAMSPPPLYTKGTGNILDGMQRAGIDRIVVISAAFVADQPSLPKWSMASAPLWELSARFVPDQRWRPRSMVNGVVRNTRAPVA